MKSYNFELSTGQSRMGQGQTTDTTFGIYFRCITDASEAIIEQRTGRIIKGRSNGATSVGEGKTEDRGKWKSMENQTGKGRLPRRYE